MMLTSLAINFGITGGLRVYAVAFTFNALSSFFNIFVLNLFLHKEGELAALGFNGICFLYAIFGTIAFLILVCFKDEKVEIESRKLSIKFEKYHRTSTSDKPKPKLRMMKA